MNLESLASMKDWMKRLDEAITRQVNLGLAGRKESKMGVPTKCDPGQIIGDYQHQSYKCVNGVPHFYSRTWFASDGSLTVVPASQLMPNWRDVMLDGQEVISIGKAGPHTIYRFDASVPELVDTGVEASPMVSFDPPQPVDASGFQPATVAGYNPGTGHWIIGQRNGQEVVGVSPGSAVTSRRIRSQVGAAAAGS